MAGVFLAGCLDSSRLKKFDCLTEALCRGGERPDASVPNADVPDGGMTTVVEDAGHFKPGPSLVLLAGSVGGCGNADGIGSAARLGASVAMTIGGDGSLYYADATNFTIRKVSPTGEVTTLAGKVGQRGVVDAVGTDAQFDSPLGIAASANGTVFVAEYGQHVIRSVSISGEVKTIAGVAGVAGALDGPAAMAQFRNPAGMALEPLTKSLVVADYGNHTLRVLDSSNKVSTVAGSAGKAGAVDGAASLSALLSFPRDVAVGGTPTKPELFMVEVGNHTVRRWADSQVSTIAGKAPEAGAVNGKGSEARFNVPAGIAYQQPSNLLFVGDYGNHAIRQVTLDGTVTLFAGQPGQVGDVDGPLLSARFNAPHSIVAAKDGSLFVNDSGNCTIRKLSSYGWVTTFAGAAPRRGAGDATGAAAKFANPYGLVALQDGTLIVADSDNHTIRKIAPGGAVVTLAGIAGKPGAVDSVGTMASFNGPQGLAVDKQGSLYIADTYNHTIRRLTPEGRVETIAGKAGASAFADGLRSDARFYLPTGLAVAPDGTLFVADYGNNCIRKIDIDGKVTTIAGVAGSPGEENGSALKARFNGPAGVALGTDGALLIADYVGNTIRILTVAGSVITFAGAGNIAGDTDGSLLVARFNGPRSIKFDASGVLYVADTLNHAVRAISPQGKVSTVVGRKGVDATVPGPLPASIAVPRGLAVLPNGELAISSNNGVLVTKRPQP